MRGNEREVENSSLTIRQQSALSIIAASPSVAQAARTSGIGQSTIYRWMEDDDFRGELTRLRRESAELARRELQGLMLRSVSVLADAMEDPDKAVRLRAARYAMSFAATIRRLERPVEEVDKLRQQIDDLEHVVSARSKHRSRK